MPLDFEKLLFRASSVGYLMVEPKSKSETISETTKTHLIDVYVSKRYGRKSDISSKAIEKGLAVEEDSITLYSRLKGIFIRKNERMFKNDFLQGTPDAIIGGVVVDFKSSWDIFTFHRSKFGKLNQQYYWQLQTYMYLTGCKSAKLVYCLIDTPQLMIEDEKRRLGWKMGLIDPTVNEDWVNASERLEEKMVYSDIPISERAHEVKINYDPQAMDRVCQRVIDCRHYMKEHFTDSKIFA